MQSFAARGLGAFAGISTDPTALTDNGHDISWGVGLRAGLQAELAPGLRFGLSGQTRFDMSRFDDYAGLFEGGGDFDIPASISAGLAFDATPDLTLMLDYQRIFFSSIARSETRPMRARSGRRAGRASAGTMSTWCASARSGAARPT